MGRASNAAPRIDLLQLVDVLQAEVTPELCRAAFGAVRTTERRRVWTLEALVRFWTAVVVRAPVALTQALQDALDQRDPLFPRVVASPEAFFQRCRDLRPAFFAEVFTRVTTRLLGLRPPRYAPALAAVQARFAAVVVVDGSGVAAIAHRLKMLWPDRRVVLPGAVVAVYDLGRGLCRHLRFSADAFVSELRQAQAAVTELPADTLVVGDRAFGHPVFFAHLQQHGCWGVVRRNRVVKLQRVACLSRARGADGELTDWQVRAGTGRAVPPQPLRWIRWRHGRTCYEVLTNVLAPERLSAAEAIALYTARWSVERMYFDLKDVLNLNRVYAANPNAVAMQVYAAGLVYNAMRVAQADAAAAVGLPPEQLSPAKLYPRLAAACHLYFGAQLWEHAMRQLNPSRRLRWIDWHQQPWATVPVAAVTVEPRSDHRRHRRFCAARAHHTSFTRVRGGRRFTGLT
jgi:hypothetical protein